MSLINSQQYYFMLQHSTVRLYIWRNYAENLKWDVSFHFEVDISGGIALAYVSSSKEKVLAILCGCWPISCLKIKFCWTEPCLVVSVLPLALLVLLALKNSKQNRHHMVCKDWDIYSLVLCRKSWLLLGIEEWKLVDWKVELRLIFQ